MYRMATIVGALVLVAGTAAAEVPAAGIYVASNTSFGSTGYDEYLYIHLIKPTGIEQVYTSKSETGGNFGWSDAKTLWRAEGSSEATTVIKYVDGKVADTVKISAADWKLPINDDLKFAMPDLLITKKGEVWLEVCTKRKEVELQLGKCLKASYLRVDAKPLVQSAKKPAGIDAYRVKKIFQEGAPLKWPKAKAPAGYSVKLQRVTVDGLGEEQKGRKMQGAVCTGPASATVTWPGKTDDLDFAMKPKKVTWLHASPALVSITGKATNPIGEIEDHEAFLFECKERVADAEFFGGDLWGVLRDVPVDEWQKTKAPKTDGSWSIYSGDKLLGTLQGSEIRVAPR